MMIFKKPKPKKSPKWNPQVYFDGTTYHAYAVHTNGKVEAASHNPKLIDAVLSADELSHMLNLYHRYGGQYKGTDKIIGEQVDPEKVNMMLKKAEVAHKEFMVTHKKIFGLK